MAWGRKKSGGRKEPQFGLGASLSELRLGPQYRIPGADDEAPKKSPKR
jgi:penicillin-binding protein 1A